MIRMQTELSGRWHQAIHRARQLAGRSQQPVLASCSIHIDCIDPFEKFDQAQRVASDQWLWTAPNGLTLVGIGVAWSVTPQDGINRISQCSHRWRSLLKSAVIDGSDLLGISSPLLIGGAAFDQNTSSSRSDIWKDFPRFRFVLPRLLIACTGDGCQLTFNCLIRPDHDLPSELHQTQLLYESIVESRLTSDYCRTQADDNGAVCNRQTQCPKNAVKADYHDQQSFHQWRTAIETALRQIHRGDIKKVVLARNLPLSASKPFNVNAALRRLRAEFPGCYLFCFGHEGSFFLGATPERLVRLQDGTVEVACLASTASRGTTPADDERLGRALLADKKSRIEHQLVADMIKEVLEPRCYKLHVPPQPELLKLPNVQHLYTPVTGTVQPGQTVLDLVESLHPTPAVGGYPRQQALAFIRRHELFDRGWYAGPVGWMGRDGEGEFAVAIRSGLVRGNRAVLFAGCGIVAGSDPIHEIRESCLKMQPLARVLRRCIASAAR